MIYWFALLSILAAIECVYIGTALSSLFPLKPSGFEYHLFSTYQNIAAPKRDVALYRVLIISGIGIFLILMRYLTWPQGKKSLFFKYGTALQGFCVLIETFFLFKYGIYRYPLWLQGFYLSLILSLVIKIFAPEIIKWIEMANQRLKGPKAFQGLTTWVAGITLGLIALIIWVPDVEGAVARMFFGEQFHHMDWLLMAAAWSHASGNIIGVDNISRYGIGAPVMVADLCQLFFGGLDYVHAVTVVMAISILYYWIWFYVLRLFLKDTVWACIALFFGLRLHFFNMETAPFIFTYPQLTPLRFFLDSFFFLFLVLHLKTGRLRWLYALAISAGLYPFYITGEGMYALVTYYAVLILREITAAWSGKIGLIRLELRQIIQLVLIPWIVLIFSLWMVVGTHVWTISFWFNQFEHIRFLQAGNSVAPMLFNLTEPFVIRASIAFILPVIYVFILLVLIGRLWQRSLTKEGLVLTVAVVFLLVSYHYHVLLANNMPSYLRNGMIISMITFYLIQNRVAQLVLYQQRLWKLGLAIGVGLMIVTTHQFLLHPNIFNLSRNPMTHPVVSQVPVGRNSYFNHLFISYPDAFKLPVNGIGEKDEMLVTENDFANDSQMKQLFEQETDYKTDTALIDALTGPTEKVALVSSFENLILIEAKRRPFFYTYFMVNSQPRRMRKFPVTILYTKDNLKRETDRIAEFKPRYIFVERSFLEGSFSRAYLYDNEDLIDLLSYIFTYYQPYKAGAFLEALKRKDS